MDPSDNLISLVYNFPNLSKVDQTTLINDLIYSFADNKSLKWPVHRRSYVIPLCKELANYPMTSDEITLLRHIRHCFQDISSVEHLDLCLMFWQITKNPQYFNYIHNITINPYHHLVSHASLIIRNL